MEFLKYLFWIKRWITGLDSIFYLLAQEFFWIYVDQEVLEFYRSIRVGLDAIWA